MRSQFGEAYAQSVAKDFVFASLGERTVERGDHRLQMGAAGYFRYDAAKPADANRNWLAYGRRSAAGKRQRDIKTGAAGQPLRQHPRFGRAAENKDSWHVAP